MERGHDIAPSFGPSPFGGGRCSVCGAPISRNEVARGGICASPDCLRTKAMREIQEENERRRMLCRTLSAESTPDRAEAGIDEERRFALAVMPALEHALVPQDPERVKTFTERIRGVILQAVAGAARDAEAGEDAEANPDTPPDEWLQPDSDPEFHSYLLAGCATCRGYCCETGKTHAYLDDKAIRRYIAQFPGRDSAEILQDYLSYLPEESYEDCCVFQGPMGCTLPRTKRAHICNSYLCRSLIELQERLEEAEQPAAVIGSADKANRLVRLTLFDGERELSQRDVASGPDQASESTT